MTMRVEFPSYPEFLTKTLPHQWWADKLSQTATSLNLSITTEMKPTGLAAALVTVLDQGGVSMRTTGFKVEYKNVVEKS
jgi:hypothetical protein